MIVLLASASPRRQQLLAAAGFPCDVHAMDVDERRWAGEAPRDYVARVAALKADAARVIYPSRVVVAADTAVVLGEEVFGKPTDEADAARMLQALGGRAHEVLTGVSVRAPGQALAYVEATTVWMAPLTGADITWYVQSGEPRDKAGAYAVQGLASRFITRIEGSYANVVGLPIASLSRVLTGLGLGRGPTPPGCVTSVPAVS